MSVDLSILLVLRDIESAVVGMVRDAQELAAGLAGDGHFELLALDEHSRDNTLSLLSILHAQIPALRTLQDLRPGAAIRRGARLARGRRWLIVDRPVTPELMRWALLQMTEHGHPAAVVPGEVLAVDAALGARALGDLRGGLVSAQREVERVLQTRGERAAWRPAPNRGVAERALLFVRGRLSTLGLGQLDRPLGV
ncbi:MAG: hypothetical protein H6710_09915 [Myxococcales bacterium]|nr:hypothetical protein [Myxococcales bacterium]MCB9700622.1 hypothetical protein [Myxococcales bacterium]